MDSLMVHRVEAIVGMIEVLLEKVELDEYDEFAERSSLGYTLLTGLTDIVDIARLGREERLAQIVEEAIEKQQWEAHEMPRFGRKNWKAAPDQRGGWFVCVIEELPELLEKIKAYLDGVADAAWEELKAPGRS